MGWLTKRLEEKQKAATVKAFEADGLQMLPMEHKSEMQLLREENEWLKMVLRDCEKKHADEKRGRVVDMTKPQSCNMFDVADEEALAEKLTEIITVCTSWIDALGYDEVKRAEIQRKVNDKNRRRGYWA